MTNIYRFIERDFDFKEIDIVEELGEETGRYHIHMRVKSYKKIKKQHLAHYARTSGHVDFRPIKKQTESNWNGGLEGYMSKENDIIHLYPALQ